MSFIKKKKKKKRFDYVNWEIYQNYIVAVRLTSFPFDRTIKSFKNE